jgi:FkbM family methyltransferase
VELRAPIKKCIRRVVERSGFELHREGVASSASIRRARLLRELGVKLVLDVGANVGRYGSDLRSYGYLERILSFEPLSGAFQALDQAASGDALWETSRIALADQEGEAEINVSASDAWSSLLARDDAARASQLDYVAAERVPVARLDSLDIAMDGPAWLKLDVQGSELRVLSGAEQMLERVAAVECELVLEPLYVGQPSVRQLVEFFDDRGLTLSAIDAGEVRESGRMVWIDGVFLR